MASTLGVSELGSWQADSVTVGQVEAALSDLRRHEERAAVRTSVLTLVIVVDRRDEAAETLGVVRHLGSRHPSRTLVLCVSDDEKEKASVLDANAAVLLVERGGRQVCVEEITLEVSGRARRSPFPTCRSRSGCPSGCPHPATRCWRRPTGSSSTRAWWATRPAPSPDWRR